VEGEYQATRIADHHGERPRRTHGGRHARPCRRFLRTHVDDLMTSSKAVTDGLATYTGTVKYKLEMNTCNLGVYTRIYVDSFTNKVVIGPNSMYPNGVYISDAAFLWKD